MNPKQNPKIIVQTRTLVGVAGLVLCVAMSVAQALPSDKQQEIKISAENASIDQKQGVITYSGAVKLTQGTLEINAEKLTLFRNSDSQSVETVIAEGTPARYQQQPDIDKTVIHAEATNITYIVSKDRLTLTKNAYVEQNGATTRGGRIEYNMTDGTVNASGAGNQSGRVEFVIPPQIDKPHTDKKE
jgi:lipopolysaccharide export system protein LptA